MADRKEVVHLRVGEEHAIFLDSLLPAGYLWESELQGDESVADIAKANAEETTGEEAVGVGPAEVFRIRAVRPGKATVRFTQRRPWEQDVEPTDEHLVELDIAE